MKHNTRGGSETGSAKNTYVAGNGAVDGNRTRAWTLARSRTTVILRPRRVIYSTPAQARQDPTVTGNISSKSKTRTCASACAEPRQIRPVKLGSGLTELRYTRRLHNRRLLLPCRELLRLFAFGIDTPKRRAIGIRNCHQPVMMLAAAVSFEPWNRVLCHERSPRGPLIIERFRPNTRDFPRRSSTPTTRCRIASPTW